MLLLLSGQVWLDLLGCMFDIEACRVINKTGMEREPAFSAALPAPVCVPRQLHDDSPGAAELVMPLKGRRLGVYWKLFEDASPEVVSACRHAVALLEEHGCEVGWLPCGCPLATAQKFTS